MQQGGPAKAAILLLSLEESTAVKIIEHLDEEELRQIQTAAEELGTINADLLKVVYGDFAVAYRSGVTSTRGSKGYLRNLVSQAHGEEEAQRVFSGKGAPMLGRGEAGARPLASLADTDPQVLGYALAAEHPQVAAAVLAHLEPAFAMEALRVIDAEQQGEIIQRMAGLEGILPTALADVEQSIGGLAFAEGEAGAVDGVSSAAALLNELGPDFSGELIDRIAEQDPQRATELRRAMFTFEALIDAEPRGLQLLLREVASETLLMSLKNASDPLRDLLLGCMSSRAAAMMLEELSMMGPARLSEVEDAQQQIVEQAMKLISEGKLHVKGTGEDMV